MIENNFLLSKNLTTDKEITYMSQDQRDYASFFPEDNSFLLTYFKEYGMTGVVDNNTIYDELFYLVKNNCDFTQIRDGNGTDFACYSCKDSEISGEYCFAIMDKSGGILFVPEK